MMHPAVSACPSVSVIVPTYERAQMLQDTLECLLAQQYPAARLDLIVVDNSSTDNTEQVVREAQQRSRFPVRFLRKENRGPAASRNYGLARATGEIVGFTDSDCRPGPGWVRSAAAMFTTGVGLVSGPILPVFNPARPVGRFFHQIDPITQEHPLYPTANVFFRTAVVRELGGFDERFGVHLWGSLVGGEDTDLAWRVKRAGYRSAFAPGAVVEHQASPVSFGRWLAEPFRSDTLPMLVSLYPELRDLLLWRRHFVYRYTPAFYFGIAGVALGAATRFPPAFLAPGLLLYMMRGLAWPHLRRPQEWWKIPAKYLLHLFRLTITVAGLWYGSVRARAVVL